MGSLEIRINAAGEDLLAGFVRVLDQIPGGDSGPQRLAKELGVDKVLTSRILKALRASDLNQCVVC
jgi:transcription initiation factor IIE alpha subunit